MSAIFALIVVNRAAGEASKSLAAGARIKPLGERVAELSHILTVGSVKPFKGFTNLLRCLRSPLRLPRSRSTLTNHG
jgi:hypothetical protein